MGERSSVRRRVFCGVGCGAAPSGFGFGEMRNSPTNFIEREQGEPLALHLFRNAEVIGADVSQRRRLRQAAQLCVRGHQMPYSATPEGRADRVEAGKIADMVNRELRGSVEEAACLAQAMGEVVVPYSDTGALRFKGRDGLWSALDAKMVTQAMADAGLRYRVLFEAAGAEQLGSQLGRVGEASIRAASSHAASIRGLHRAYAGVRVTTVEAHVLTADPSQRALLVLRAVAGEGHTIASLGGGGSRRGRNAEALRLALGIVVSNLGETEGLRIGGN